MTRRTITVAGLVVLALIPAVLSVAQLGGSRWLAMPLAEDPGISWVLVTETPEYRVLRDFARPGATRRMHQHADATWHVLTLTTGQLTLTIEGQTPVNVHPGRPVVLEGGVMHTFTNPGTEVATVIEVFGRARR